MKLSLTLALAILISLLLIGCEKSPEQKAAQLYEQGLAELRKYRFEEAASLFEEIGNIHPASELGLFGTGLILERRFLSYDALYEFMVISDARPAFTEAMEASWRILTRLEEYEIAKSVAAQYYDRRPLDPKPKVLFARALINTGQHVRARSLLDTAVQMGYDPVIAELIRARAFAEQNMFDSGQSSLDRATAQPSENPDYSQALADYFEAVGLADSAMFHSRRSMRQAQQDHFCTLEHFDRSLRLNYYMEARRTIAAVENIADDSMATAGMRIDYHLDRDEITLARKWMSYMMGSADQKLTPIYLDLVITGSMGDMLSAVQDADAIGGYMVKHNYLKPFQDFMTYRVATQLTWYGLEPAALKQLDRVRGEYTNTKVVKLAYAYLYGRRGMWEEFDDLLVLIERFHSNQPDWLVGLAKENARIGIRRYAKAEELYGRALAIDKWHLPAIRDWVNLKRRLDHPGEALSLFERYSHIEKRYPQARIWKSYCLVEDGQVSEGTQLFRTAIPILSGDLTNLTEMISLLRRRAELESTDSLVDFFTVSLSPDNSDALTIAAEWKIHRGHHQNALELADRVLEIEPGYVPALVIRARATSGLGNIDEAVAQFETVLATDKDCAINNRYYSQVLASQKLEPLKAANLARTALFNQPGDLDAWDNLCYVYFQGERYDLCYGEATKILDSYRDHPFPYFWMGMAHYMQDKPDEAREYLNEAVNLGLSGDRLTTARRTLDELDR